MDSRPSIHTEVRGLESATRGPCVSRMCVSRPSHASATCSVTAVTPTVSALRQPSRSPRRPPTRRPRARPQPAAASAQWQRRPARSGSAPAPPAGAAPPGAARSGISRKSSKSQLLGVFLGPVCNVCRTRRTPRAVARARRGVRGRAATDGDLCAPVLRPRRGRRAAAHTARTHLCHLVEISSSSTPRGAARAAGPRHRQSRNSNKLHTRQARREKGALDGGYGGYKTTKLS